MSLQFFRQQNIPVGFVKLVSSKSSYYRGAKQQESLQILDEGAKLWMRLGRQALSGFVKFQKQVTLPKLPKIKGLSRHLHIRSSPVKTDHPEDH